ncbi:DUF4252 domain-containing protein [Chitinophaga sp. CF418]|uniref:DUF4252 domain-containing protein n=1 Tax=Chitinophaga sp. CF418 TaxID=1855287 RepID=UPI00091899CA|nr:DUF4252 domain-containing protein [Chitinophaga sp. CF418]SHN39336.1 protein of unknown function [Chitinophaga sp. CF418]
MKYCSILVAALLLAVSPAMAQKKSLRKFYREQRRHSDVMGVRIGVGRIPLKLASWIVPKSAMKEEGVPLKRLIGKVQKVKVYTLMGSQNFVDVASIQRLKQTLMDKDGFETLMEVRHEGANVFIMNKGREDELGNVVMLVQEDTEFVIVSLRTKLHMNDVNTLIEGFAKN